MSQLLETKKKKLLRRRTMSVIELDCCSILDSLESKTEDVNRSYAYEDFSVSIPCPYSSFQPPQVKHVLLVDPVPCQPL